MKWLMTLLTVAGLTGCALWQDAPPSPAAPAGATTQPARAAGDGKLLVTPAELLAGKVAAYNAAGRFVVLDFPAGHMPLLDQTLFVYRLGLKVGEVKVTGPQRDNNTVADLVSGEAQKGDDVRDK
jgi:hypothetical protein